MLEFPKPSFNVQEDQDPEAHAVYRSPFTQYNSGYGNHDESDTGQDVEVGFVNEHDFDLLSGEDDIACDALLTSMDELLSGSGPEPGGVEGISDGIRVGGISPDSDTEAVDLRPSEDLISDADFESFVEYVMEEANPIEGFGGEERERFNDGSHCMVMGGFETFEGSSRFSALEGQQDPSEDFSRPLLEILLPSDFHVNDIDLNMEIDGAESSLGLSAPEGDRVRRGSSRSLGDLRPDADHEDSVFDRYFGRFEEYGMEAVNPIEQFEGEECDGCNLSAPEEQQDPSENFPRLLMQILLRRFHVNDIDLSMEIDRAESSSSFLAAEEDQESAVSLISLNEFMLSHDFRVGDTDLNIEVEGTESASSLSDREGDQQLLEDSPRDLRASGFDLNMEIERIVPPSPLSAIEEELEELDTREDFLISTNQMMWDASSLANGGMIPTARMVLKNLPVVKVGKEDLKDGSALVCTVCTDEIAEGEMVNMLPCWHYYHGDCILPWLRVKNTCPVCRYELPIDEQ